MRLHGTLIKWNDDRGFGFIKSSKGDSEVFVHISAFARDDVRPHIGELISFELEDGKDGRQRAVRVMRPGQRSRARPATTSQGRRLRRSWRDAVFSLLIVAGIAGYFSIHHASGISSSQDNVSEPFLEEKEPPPSFHCDGRTRCPEMRSCREATFFLKNCPGAAMDGDGDGIPCEDQWCGH